MNIVECIKTNLCFNESKIKNKLLTQTNFKHQPNL